MLLSEVVLVISTTVNLQTSCTIIISHSIAAWWQLQKSGQCFSSLAVIMVWGKQGVKEVVLKPLGFSVTVVAKTALENRIKKLDSVSQKSCREGTALILGIHSCSELLKDEDLWCHYSKQHGCTEP